MIRRRKRGGNILGEITSRIRAAASGPRRGPPPDVRAYLEKHKNHPITMLSVCRVPIHSAIDTALGWMTLGEWGKAKKRKNYDDMFHLYMLIGMGDHSAITERNQVVRLEDAPESKLAAGDCVPVRVKPGMTLGSLMRNGEAMQPGGDWWVYDPIHNNCQDYIMTLLEGNGISSPKLKEFVKQDTADLLPDYIRQFARKVTDVAASADILVKGKGFRGRGIVGEFPYVKPKFVRY